MEFIYSFLFLKLSLNSILIEKDTSLTQLSDSEFDASLIIRNSENRI